MNWQQAVLAIMVGAVIGYVTNWIAIRMLFRPRHEVRVLGIHIPFTPGVIPRGKSRLAGGVGQVVGGMLLTEEKVVQHLLRPEVETLVRRHVRDRLDELVTRGATVGQLLGDPNHRDAAPLQNRAAQLLADTALGVLSQPELRRPLSRLLVQTLAAALDKPVGQVAGTPGFDQLRDFLSRVPGTMLAREEVAEQLHDRLARRVENFLNSPEKVGSYLPGALREGLHQLITDQTPRLIAALEQYLNSPGARRAIKNRIEDFFEGTALKRLLNGMFQLVGSGSDAMVGRLAREFSSFLADEKNRAEIEERLHILLDEALDKSVAETTAALDAAGRRDKAREFAGWLLEQLRRPDAAEPVLDALEEVLAANRHRSWRQLLQVEELGLEEKLAVYLERLLGDLPEQEAGRRLVDDLARRLVSGLWNAPVAGVMAVLPPGLASDPGEPALRLYRYVVRNHVPGLLGFFDVTAMVRQRVEELDVLQVEDMVLGIVRRELTAITWLGGLLGALLAAVMVAMQLVMR